MKKYTLLLLILFVCAQINAHDLTLQKIETHTESSFRGLVVVNDSIAWLSGTKGWIGISKNAGHNWDFKQVEGFEKCDFRSLYAFDDKRAVIANAGSPANILITKDGGLNWKVVYTNTDSVAFFDGMAFRDGKNGIIYGDPINGRMLILRSNDGGESWNLLPANSRPLLEKGESSFAASGTGIRLYAKKEIIISTGGKFSRLFKSVNNGKSWSAIPAPVIQGKNSTGIFSFAFYNNDNGVIVGGDYLADTLRSKHVFYTTDRAKTWLKPNTTTRGYRECVTYLDAKTLVATGPTGIDISVNGGVDWQALSDVKGLHVIKASASGKCIIAAGQKGSVYLLNK